MDIRIPSSTPAIESTRTSDRQVQPRDAAHGDATFQQILAHASRKPDKIADAATQFEACILSQVLKTARQSSEGGWLGTGEDQAGELGLELAEQEFTQALASRGGLGIAKLVTASLQHRAKAANFDPENPSAQVQASTGSDGQSVSR